jgi:putative DNA primase/helicase
VPQLKLLISGNHKPGLRSVDEAIRRRFHLLPFTITIPPEERILGYADTLKSEWPAILKWMIDGCLEWQRIGLNPPAAVRDATAAYLDAQDAVGAWLEERCDVHRNAVADRNALFKSWSAWATAANEALITSTSLYDALEARGFKQTKYAGKRQFKGLMVKPEPHWTD